MDNTKTEGKTLEEMTREELAAIATDWKVEFTDETTDEQLRTLIDEKMDAAEPVTPEMLDRMSRDEMLEIAAGMGHELKGNEAAVRKQLKAMLKTLENELEVEPSTSTTNGTKTIEQWADEKRLPSWQLAAAMQANKWAAGKLLTEEQLIKGLDALNRPMGR